MVACLVISDDQSNLVFEAADQCFSRTYDKDCQLHLANRIFYYLNIVRPFLISQQDIISA